MKKILIIITFFLFLSSMFIINLDNSISMPILNSNYFFIPTSVNSLNMNLAINGTTNSISPNGDWNYKNPVGLYSKESFIFSSPYNIDMEELSSVEVFFDIVPDSVKFNLVLDNISHTFNSMEELINSITSNGSYEIIIKASWNKESNTDYYGFLDYKIELNVDFPPNLEIKTINNYPGNILILSINNIGVNNSELNTDLSHGLISTGKIGNALLYFIPIDIWAKPGNYSLSIKLTDDKNNTVNLGKIISINSKDFTVQYLYVSDEVYEATNNDAAYKEFREKAQAARSSSEMKKYWEGKFIFPVNNFKLSTDYGEIRYVNDQITSTRHSGLDLAADEGTEVVACNNGKIALSEYLILTGNTIIIDHGMGVFSSYYHMNSLNVKEGDIVNKGDLVGTVGSTGFSTGPHLHWSISIFNTYVNTHQVIDEGLL